MFFKNWIDVVVSRGLTGGVGGGAGLLWGGGWRWRRQQVRRNHALVIQQHLCGLSQIISHDAQRRVGHVLLKAQRQQLLKHTQHHQHHQEDLALDSWRNTREHTWSSLVCLSEVWASAPSSRTCTAAENIILTSHKTTAQNLLTLHYNIIITGRFVF